VNTRVREFTMVKKTTKHTLTNPYNAPKETVAHKKANLLNQMKRIFLLLQKVLALNNMRTQTWVRYTQQENITARTTTNSMQHSINILKHQLEEEMREYYWHLYVHQI
jgi:hypothetical protein